PDRRLAAGAGALREDLDSLQSVLHSLLRGRVGGHLGGERRRLAGSLEAGRPGGLPGDHVALGVRERDDRVVERSLDMRLPIGDVLPNPATRATLLRGWHLGRSSPAHLGDGAFFFPATLIRRGPLRPRALVLVL